MIWIHHPVIQTPLLNHPKIFSYLRERGLTHASFYETISYSINNTISLPLILPICHLPLFSLAMKKSFAVAQMSCTSPCTSFCYFGLSLLHDTWLTSPQSASKSLDTQVVTQVPLSTLHFGEWCLFENPVSHQWSLEKPDSWIYFSVIQLRCQPLKEENTTQCE